MHARGTCIQAMLQISASYSKKKDKKASDLSMCGENALLIIIFDDPPNVLPWMHYIQIILMYHEIARRKDIHNWIIHNLVI